MSVRKYRTFEEARRDLWLPSGDPRVLQVMKRLGQMARRREPGFRGVLRFRTIEEAKAYKEDARPPGR